MSRRHVDRPQWERPPGPDIKVARDRQNGRSVGTIAMCLRDKISSQTAISLLMSDMGFLAPGEVVNRAFVQGHILTMQRNECVLRMEGDWLLFVDDDMIWAPGAIRTLVETQRKFDLDMVGGLCFQRGEPYQPTLYVFDQESGNYVFREDWVEDAAVEVDATGMAFMLIHRRVFERILGEPLPSLEERQHMPPPPFFKWTGEYGEDFLFCREAKEAGCRIFVDTSVKIGHITEVTIGEPIFLQQILSRPHEAYLKRKAMNDRLNLPTRSPQMALERLRELGMSSNLSLTPSAGEPSLSGSKSG